jgi:hypothetical protein
MTSKPIKIPLTAGALQAPHAAAGSDGPVHGDGLRGPHAVGLGGL